MRVDLVLAPNPGLYTGPGTNTWIVAAGADAVVIDPGPVIAEHQAAIRSGVADLDVGAVLVTHTHPDHAPAANELADRLGVPAIGFGPGPDFSPDRTIADGDVVTCGGLEVSCVATPGHTPDSVSYRMVNALFTGDHIMGGSTVVIEDMTDYMASLQRLQDIGLETIYPGHGPVIDAPDAVIADYVAHRMERERQIVDALVRGAVSLGEIVVDVYADVDPGLHPAASMSVSAHLAKLKAEGRVLVADEPTWGSKVALT
jgi:glyoxylase-like metal-dependent hydrolase (beta-lactamase superfamily II)